MSRSHRRKPGPARLPASERAANPEVTAASVSGVPFSGEGVVSRAAAEAEPAVVRDERTFGFDAAESLQYPERGAEEINPSYTTPPAEPGTGQPRRRT